MLKPLMLILGFSISIFCEAQSGSGGGSSNTYGLKFDNYQLISGTDLKAGAKYLFSNVDNNVDAVISIDSLVNGAKVSKIDDNSNGTGYKDAFQPAVQSGNVIGLSYAVFTIKFYEHNTTNSYIMPTVNATALDIDGNATLKEFCRINTGVGSIMNYLMTNPDISVLQILPGDYIGQNVLGIERNGIDTSYLNNMFTAKNNNISSLTVRYGTLTIVSSSSSRQHSLYMKGFAYPGSTLPVKLTAFTATLNNNNKVDLKWSTASEINVSHFVIERSTDGSNYSDIGMVFAYGNSTDQKNYTYTDNVSNFQTAIVYYRLRSVDIDEKAQYSETRVIRISKQSEATVNIVTYPNPVSSELRITIPTNWQNKKVIYEIFQANGQVAKRIESASSSQTETMNVSQLSSGFYFVRVTCNGEIAIQKIIKH